MSSQVFHHLTKSRRLSFTWVTRICLFMSHFYSKIILKKTQRKIMPPSYFKNFNDFPLLLRSLTKYVICFTKVYKMADKSLLSEIQQTLHCVHTIFSILLTIGPLHKLSPLLLPKQLINLSSDIPPLGTVLRF